jgi:RimJ/RimL family protein N-acetyltransferase
MSSRSSAFACLGSASAIVRSSWSATVARSAASGAVCPRVASVRPSLGVPLVQARQSRVEDRRAIVESLGVEVAGFEHGGIGAQHVEAYLDEFIFRFNRRQSNARRPPFYRLLQNAVVVKKLDYETIVWSRRGQAGKLRGRKTAVSAPQSHRLSTRMMTLVVLRPFEEDDFSFILQSIASADELLQWAGPGFEWPLTEAQLRDYRDKAARDPERFRQLTAVEGDAPVGHVELTLERKHDLGYIGRVVVAPSERGRGLGTALMREVVRFAFGDLRLHRISLNVFDFNTPAVRCYERVGFIKEGHLRETRRASDGYWSLFVMGMLATDPRPAAP